MNSMAIAFFSVAFLSASLSFVFADDVKSLPQDDRVRLFASFSKGENAEFVKTGRPLKWNGLYEFKTGEGVDGRGAVFAGVDGFAEIDGDVIDPKCGTVAFWFKPSGDPMGGSHTYLSWSWNSKWRDGAAGGDSYMVMSQGWWENGGGAGSTYAVFCNGFSTVTASSSEKVGMWSHYTLTWRRLADGHYEIVFYRNGSSVKSLSSDSMKDGLKLASKVFLGADKGSCLGAGRYADGFFNDFIVWDAALNGDEVKALMMKKAPAYVAREFENPLFWMEDAKSLPYREKRDSRGVLLESRTVFAEGRMIYYQPEADILKDLDRLKRSGFNVYMPTVWHGSGMECESKAVATTKRWRLHAGSRPDFDSYGFMVDEAHKRGIEIHPAFAVMQGDANGYDPKFRDFIVDAIVSHVREYPVDGVNLDFIRIMGGLEAPESAAEYKRLYGRELKDGRSSSALMMRFASDCVGDIVKRVSEGVRAVRQGVIVSCDCSSQTVMHGLAGNGRNPRLWIENGWVDVAFNMDYGQRLGVEVFDAARADVPRPYAWVEGLGNYDYIDGKCLPRDPKTLARLMDYCRRKYNDGNGMFVYFWSTLSDGQIDALRAGPFKELARPSWRR